MQLTVVFKNMLPSEELIRLARRLMRDVGLMEPVRRELTLLVENTQTDEEPLYSVSVASDLERPKLRVSQRDPRQAVRDALSALAAGLRESIHVG